LTLCTFTGCFQTREEIAREKEDQEVRSNLQQNVAEYGQGLDKVQADIGRLQGRIEELEHQRKKEIAGIATAREAEQKTNEKAIQELTAKVTAMQEAQNALFEEVKKIREESVSERPKAVSTGKKKGSTQASPTANFDAALSAYKAHDYAAASNGFRAFLEGSPKSKRALDARYYLADSLFKQKDYEQAVVEFGSVHEKAPTTFYGRRSALRLAQSFKSMGKGKDAKAFAQLLEQESPDSEEAKTARKMFK
ncbi:MAG: tetratricopeptide repeat protein, partial [Bdellovibrionota bacterium]